MPLIPLPPNVVPLRPRVPKPRPLATVLAWRRSVAGIPDAPPFPPPTRPVVTRLRAVHTDDGMSTAEYAIGTLAAAAFAAVLYGVVTGDSVVGALTALVQRALSVNI
ncbi:MAG: DUF4244 domain-containing protein [Actinophytocola sp.]|nr:DUF4244 domain-containing protein [Actinophytocola sp.]